MLELEDDALNLTEENTNVLILLDDEDDFGASKLDDVKGTTFSRRELGEDQGEEEEGVTVIKKRCYVLLTVFHHSQNRMFSSAFVVLLFN